jgi:hypothetical protein
MRATVALLALVLSGTLLADDKGSSLDTITVTGSRISYRDLLDTPAISLTKPGDYLMQQITLINDSRSEETRKQEIYATIDRMLGEAGSHFQLMYGADYHVVLDKSSSQVELETDSKRPDVSKVDLYVRVAVSADTTSEETRWSSRCGASSRTPTR